MSDKPNPGSEVLIKSLTARRVDESRIRASVKLTENQSIPKIALLLLDADNKELAKTIIMGVMGSEFDFTLHIRSQNPRLPIHLTCELYQDEETLLTRESIEV